MKLMVAAVVAAACACAICGAVPAAGQEPITSPNISHVKNLGYEAQNGTMPNFGTDIEFATVAGRDYALAGSYRNGLQIVDITEPTEAEIVGVYDCGITQGAVQVLRQAV